MKCYIDQYEIPEPDEENRFCPNCGAVQFQECEICKEKVIINQNSDKFSRTCPNCSALFRYCSRCYRLHYIDKSFCLNNCPEGYLQDFWTGYQTLYVNFRRSNSMTLKGPLEDLYWKSKDYKQPISQPVSYYGYVFLGTRDGSMYSFNEINGESYWKGTPNLDEDISLALLSIYNHILLVLTENSLYGLDITSGESLFSMPLTTWKKGKQEAVSIALLRDFVFIFSTKKDYDLIEAYSIIGGAKPLFSFELPFRDSHVSSFSNRLLFTLDKDTLYFTNRAFHIFRIDVNGVLEKLWDNPENHILSHLSIDNDKLCFMSRAPKGELYFNLFNLTNDIFSSMKFDYIPLPFYSIVDGVLITFDREEKKIKKHILKTLYQEPEEYQLPLNCQIKPVLALKKGEALYLLFIYYEDNIISELRMMYPDGSQRKLTQGYSKNIPGFIVTNNGVLFWEKNTGKIIALPLKEYL